MKTITSNGCHLVNERLDEVAADRYLEALDRIMDDYQTYIPYGVKEVIENALTAECPKCRKHAPLTKVKSPYISRFYGRLCKWCMIEEMEHYD